MTEHALQLADGRRLGYACYGANNARPVLYFHGTPSSRLEPRITEMCGMYIETVLQRYGLQLIAVDRPGMGLSSFHQQLSLEGFARDVATLLQALGIEHCPLLCWSGGGPYALAMAYHYPQIISGVYIVAGFSASFGNKEVLDRMSWNKLYFITARKLPLVLKSNLFFIKHQRAKMPITQDLYDLSNPDYAILKNVARLNLFLDVTIKESCRNSTAGPVQEAQLYFQPFPFALRDILTPVHFWWGTEDNAVTYVHAKHLEKSLPQVTPHYKPGQGHVSIYINYIEEVLQTIAGSNA